MRVKLVTNAGGAVTYFAYDEDGNTLRVREPSGAQWHSAD